MNISDLASSQANPVDVQIEKPASAGTATGNVLEVNRGHSMSNGSTRAVVRKVDVSGNKNKTHRKSKKVHKDFQLADPELLMELLNLSESDRDKACAYIAFRLEGWEDDVEPQIDEVLLGTELNSSDQYNLMSLYQRCKQNMHHDVDDLKRDYERIIPHGDDDYAPVRAMIAKYQLEVRKLVESKQDRPTVRFRALLPEVHLTLAEIEIHLGKAGIFNRNGALARVAESDHLKQRIEKEVIPRPVIQELTPQAATPRLTQTIRFIKETERVVQGRPVIEETLAMPPKILIEQLLCLGHYENTPIILGLQDGPFLRHDGTVCNTFGYDPASMWFLCSSCDGISGLDESVSECEAGAYTERLMNLTRQFPFKSQKDHAAWLAAVLTLIARPAIRGPVPAFMLTANNRGVGKSLLVHAAHALAYGRHAASFTAPQGKESTDEWRKTLYGIALAGSPFAWFDELEHGSTAGNSAINQYLTARTVQERLLHTMESREAPWLTTIFLSGNSISIGSDLGRRAVSCVLQTTLEKPEERPCSTFEIPDLIKYIDDERADLLTAAFSILRWHLANQVRNELPGFAMYEQWDRIVRQCVYRLTGEDVCQHDEFIIDQNASELQALISALNGFQAFHSQTSTVPHWSATDVHNAVTEHSTTEWAVALGEMFDASLSKQKYVVTIGTRLNKFKSRPCDGYAVSQLTIDKKKRYRIISI